MGNTKKVNVLTKIPLPHNLGKIWQIACGWYDSIFTTERNEIYGCGGNHYGELGLGNEV